MERTMAKKKKSTGPTLPEGCHAAVRIPGGRGDYLMIGRSLFEGRDLLNIRVWYTSAKKVTKYDSAVNHPFPGGFLNPSSKGLAVPADYRENIREALNHVLDGWDDLDVVEQGSGESAGSDDAGPEVLLA